MEPNGKVFPVHSPSIRHGALMAVSSTLAKILSLDFEKSSRGGNKCNCQEERERFPFFTSQPILSSCSNYDCKKARPLFLAFHVWVALVPSLLLAS